VPGQAEVADFRLLRTLAYLFRHAGELVAEGHPHPGVRHGNFFGFYTLFLAAPTGIVRSDFG